MSDVAPFAGFPESVAFNSFGEDHRRAALMFCGCFVSGVNFSRIVTSAQEFAKLIVCEMIDRLQQLGIFAEKMFADVTARRDRVLLVVSVHSFLHALN